MHKPDYFDGVYRATFTGKDSDQVPKHLLETAGIVLPDGSQPTPLRFFDAQRKVWQRPASRMPGFDFGSVPASLQSLVSPLTASRAFAMHDAAYVNHGWWESPAADGPYTFVPKNRHEVDEMLIRWMIVDGTSVLEAELAFEGVYLGGGDLWDSHKGPFPVGTFIDAAAAAVGKA